MESGAAVRREGGRREGGGSKRGKEENKIGGNRCGKLPD
jgi:hypothetical protein